MHRRRRQMQVNVFINTFLFLGVPMLRSLENTQELGMIVLRDGLLENRPHLKDVFKLFPFSSRWQKAISLL